MSVPPAQQSPAAKALQHLGYSTKMNTGRTSESSPTIENIPQETHQLNVKLLCINVTMPKRATADAAGCDVYSAIDVIIPPQTRTLIPLDILDPDYTGNIKVLLHNHGPEPFHVNIGDRIAQLLLLNHETPKPTQIDNINTTSRGDHCFGSTGNTAIIHNMTSTTSQTPSIDPSPNIIDEPPHVKLETNPTISIPPDLLCDIYLSTDPFDSLITIHIPEKGDHETLGMVFQHCPHHNRIQLKDIALNTPGSRIPKWRSTLRNAYLTNFNNQPIYNHTELIHAISHARKQGTINATCQFATDRRYGIHPHHGVPQLYFDQLNIIGQHLHANPAPPTATA